MSVSTTALDRNGVSNKRRGILVWLSNDSDGFFMPGGFFNRPRTENRDWLPLTEGALAAHVDILERAEVSMRLGGGVVELTGRDVGEYVDIEKSTTDGRPPLYASPVNELYPTFAEKQSHTMSAEALKEAFQAMTLVSTAVAKILTSNGGGGERGTTTPQYQRLQSYWPP